MCGAERRTAAAVEVRRRGLLSPALSQTMAGSPGLVLATDRRDRGGHRGRGGAARSMG